MRELYKVAFVASMAVLASGCGSDGGNTSDDTMSSAVYDCLLQSDWTQVAPNPGPCNCTPSTWHFTKDAAGTVSASEDGCGHASGPVTTDGTTVTISYTYGSPGSGGAGVYKFPINDCKGGEGSVTVTAGSACVNETFVIDWSPASG